MSVDLTPQNVITFIKDDPRNVGFQAIRNAYPGADQPLVNAANSTTGPGAGSVDGDPMSSSAFLDLLDATEFGNFNSAQLAQLNTLMAPQTVNLGSKPTQDKLDAVLASYATSKASVQARYTRAGSPWEVYFGKGSQADQSTIDNARNYGPNAPNF